MDEGFGWYLPFYLAFLAWYHLLGLERTFGDEFSSLENLCACIYLFYLIGPPSLMSLGGLCRLALYIYISCVVLFFCLCGDYSMFCLVQPLGYLIFSHVVWWCLLLRCSLKVVVVLGAKRVV